MTYQVARREFGGQTPRSMVPLVEVARRGDKVAFSVLYEHYRGDVFRFVLGKVRDVTDAEDLTQQTFVRAWEGLPQLLASSSFESWLSRIADNCVHNFWRSRYSKDLSLWAEGETAFSYLQDQRPDPEESLLFREHLSEALASLPDRQRAILIWYSVEGFSLEEIAERLGISVSSVMAYLSVARRHFRAAYWPAGNKQSPNRETNALAQVEKRSVAEEKRSRQFEAADLGAAWHLLREPYRTAVQLYMEGNTHREIAERLQRPLGTVKAQIYRGYALLQELIAQKDGDDVGMQRGAEELLASIGRLPKVYQEVLYLYHIEGRKQHEIAQRLQRPLGTVKAQISRGLKLLNKQTAKSQEQAAELSLENV